MLLLCLSPAVRWGSFIGIEVQKRRSGVDGALASTINIIVLDNPMTFHFASCLDSALAGKLSPYAGVYRLIPAGAYNPKIEPVACCLISLFRCGLGNDDQRGTSKKPSACVISATFADE